MLWFGLLGLPSAKQLLQHGWWRRGHWLLAAACSSIGFLTGIVTSPLDEFQQAIKLGRYHLARKMIDDEDG